MNEKRFTLPCYDNRKSFNNKAYCVETGKTIILESYGTKVGFIRGGVFHRTWGGYSATTMRHVKNFLEHYDMLGGIPHTKAWWDSLKV